MHNRVQDRRKREQGPLQERLEFTRHCDLFWQRIWIEPVLSLSHRLNFFYRQRRGVEDRFTASLAQIVEATIACNPKEPCLERSLGCESGQEQIELEKDKL